MGCGETVDDLDRRKKVDSGCTAQVRRSKRSSVLV